MHVVLYQPEIPPNVGNVARQCVGMDATLHIVGPHALDFSSSRVRRAGLDYWEHLRMHEHATPEDFEHWLAGRTPWLVTKFGDLRYDQPAYAADDVLLFGNELRGLPDAWHEHWPGQRVSVPILGQVRSYNLSNTVAMVLAAASLRAGRFGKM